MSVSPRPLAPTVSRSEPPITRPSVVVVADDDRVQREAIATLLRDSGHQVLLASDGQEAVELVGQQRVDLVLLDILMPRLGGIEACRIIKGMTVDSFVPVLLVTSRTDTAARAEGLKIGADDYVTKPFENRELLARIEALLRLRRLHDHLVSVRQKLERLSVYDELTGLYNFRYLHTRLREEFRRAEIQHEPLACVLLDIDQMRKHNDAGGQALGDVIIRGVADIIRRCVRDSDVVARYGGEEFLIIMPNTHLAGSVALAERIRRDVASRTFSVDRSCSVHTSVTIGVALYPSPEIKSKESLLRGADAALTQAKRDGSDRICVFQQQGYIYSPKSPDPKAG